MSETTTSPEACLDLALSGEQGSVHEWVAAPANSPNAPPTGRSWSGAPQVIYAEYKPRLSGPELLARYGGAATTPARVECSHLMADRPPARAARGGRVGLLRPVWWGVLVMAAAAMSAGAPVI